MNTGWVQLFEKFGLSIGFLTLMVWLYIKADEKFSQERKEHRSERGEWRSSQVKLQSDTNEALKDLTRAIGHLERKLKD
jgi:hypothetical protein